MGKAKTWWILLKQQSLCLCPAAVWFAVQTYCCRRQQEEACLAQRWNFAWLLFTKLAFATVGLVVWVSPMLLRELFC